MIAVSKLSSSIKSYGVLTGDLKILYNTILQNAGGEIVFECNLGENGIDSFCKVTFLNINENMEWRKANSNLKKTSNKTCIIVNGRIKN